LEVADAYFATGRAQKALVIISENNSLYNNLSDPKSGFLWGDGAAAVFISNERYSDDDLEVVDINTRGLGNIGKNIDGVYLRPLDGGLKMPYGKDVFQQACTYMVEETEQLLAKNNLSVADINYLIPHQANIRIIDYVARSLNISKEQVLNNIEFLGNTGSASAAIVLAQNISTFKKGDKIVITVFGGGYSSGTALLKK
jgi:3-oxoacyl-[acyl-carrier-protein] synthase-3